MNFRKGMSLIMQLKNKISGKILGFLCAPSRDVRTLCAENTSNLNANSLYTRLFV